MNWIKMEDRIPELNKNVLTLVDGEIIQGYISESGLWEFVSLCFHGCKCCSSDDDVVTHWAELPPLPG